MTPQTKTSPSVYLGILYFQCIVLIIELLGVGDTARRLPAQLVIQQLQWILSPLSLQQMRVKINPVFNPAAVC